MKNTSFLFSKDFSNYCSNYHSEMWNFWIENYPVKETSLGIEFMNLSKQDQKIIENFEKDYQNI